MGYLIEIRDILRITHLMKYPFHIPSHISEKIWVFRSPQLSRTQTRTRKIGDPVGYLISFRSLLTRDVTRPIIASKASLLLGSLTLPSSDGRARAVTDAVQDF